jgi:hypothetical protein
MVRSIINELISALLPVALRETHFHRRKGSYWSGHQPWHRLAALMRTWCAQGTNSCRRQDLTVAHSDKSLFLRWLDLLMPPAIVRCHWALWQAVSLLSELLTDGVFFGAKTATRWACGHHPSFQSDQSWNASVQFTFTWGQGKGRHRIERRLISSSTFLSIRRKFSNGKFSYVFTCNLLYVFNKSSSYNTKNFQLIICAQ